MDDELNIRAYCDGDRDDVVQLWEGCGLVVPWNDPHDDIARKLLVQPELFLVGVADGEVVATVMAGYDGHRGWLNYLAVAAGKRRQGWGRKIVEAAEKELSAMGCVKVNLQVRATNGEVVKFYQGIGYKIDDVISLGKRFGG